MTSKYRRHEQQSNSTAPTRATRSTWARAPHVAAINIRQSGVNPATQPVRGGCRSAHRATAPRVVSATRAFPTRARPWGGALPPVAPSPYVRATKQGRVARGPRRAPLRRRARPPDVAFPTPGRERA